MDVQSAAWGINGSPVQHQPIYLLPLLFDLFRRVDRSRIASFKAWIHGQKNDLLWLSFQLEDACHEMVWNSWRTDSSLVVLVNRR